MADALLHPSVELTFDDGPDPVWTPRVLDALGEHGLRATFFVIGPRAVAHPDLVDRIVREGHAVQLHCHEHVRADELGARGVARDTVLALAELAGLGVAPTRWRPPWGVVIDPMHDLARGHGLVLTGWTADTEDWRGAPAADGLALVEPRLEADAVVLLHDGVGPGATRPGCATTVELVGLLAGALAARGLTTHIPAREDLIAPVGDLPRGGSGPLAAGVAA